MVARNTEEGSKSVFIGAAVYPTLAMCNHSCDPSIVRFYIESTVCVQVSTQNKITIQMLIIMNCTEESISITNLTSHYEYYRQSRIFQKEKKSAKTMVLYSSIPIGKIVR